jgi:hypothetical protein
MPISVSTTAAVQTGLSLPSLNNSTDFEVYVREGIDTSTQGQIILNCLINVPANKQLVNNSISLIGNNARTTNHRRAEDDYVPHRDVNGQIVKALDLALNLTVDNNASASRVFSAQITIINLPNKIHYITFADGNTPTSKKKAVAVHSNIEPMKK